MTSMMKDYALRVAAFPPWGVEMMADLQRWRSTLGALKKVNLCSRPDDQWTFCQYINNKDVQDEFIELATAAIDMATALPSGEHAYRDWDKYIDEDRIESLSRLVQRVRAAFEYETLDQWHADFEYALEFCATRSSGVKPLRNSYKELLYSHNHSNWNKLRLPFVFSRLHRDCELLGFFYCDWEVYASYADERLPLPGPFDAIEFPSYLEFLCLAIRQREAWYNPQLEIKG